MDQKKFVDGQRKGVDAICALFVIVIALMWFATLLDYIFNFGWGWDRQILWLGPPMIVFAFLLRFCARAIFKFVDSNY